MRWRSFAIFSLPALAVLVLAVPATRSRAADENARLAEAKAQSAAADARARALEARAAGERNAAARAATEEAAVAARIERAEADISAAHARIALVRRALEDQRTALAVADTPIARLLGALQSLAGRPPVISLVQPGSVRDLVHIRAVLGSVAPVIAARTASLRAELARARRLEAGEQLAFANLAQSHAMLEDERLKLARLEADHRLRSRALGRQALVESDRAIAMGERARDLVDQLADDARARETASALAALPGPLPRPGSAAETPLWDAGSAPYRLPVEGRLVTGLGEISDAGVRARGLTIAPAPGAAVVAPAAGRVRFAQPFRAFGIVVVIDHGGGWSTMLTNLASASVVPGARVAQGTRIGRAGDGPDPRVTVELRRRDRPVDLTRLIG